jgi:Rap1a immunity proteins
MKRLLTIAALLTGLSAVAHAQTQNGMYLKKMCAKPEPESTFTATQASVTAYANSEWCYGFITGYFAFGKRADFPVPDDVTAEQFRLVLVRYMDSHPQELHLDASEVLMRAAYDAWKK